MKFRTGLFQARGQIAFIVGLAVASALAVSLDRAQGKPVLLVVAPPKGVVEVWKSTPSPVARPLSDDERREALIAWQYFRNNTQKSGMVNSVDKYPSTTMWDTGSALLATMSAERLGIITRSELDGRLATMLGSLARMQLFTGVLPNKSYDTTSMLMVDYANKPAPDGIGWSAVDLARLVLALRTVAWQYPEQTEAVRQVLRRWDTRPMLRDGLLYGARRKNGKVDQVQEGRLGYEEYAARALMLDGRDASAALAFASELKYETVDGVRVPTDRRTSRDRGAFNYVVSEPYILTGLELGWDYSSRQFAYSVY
ncbi:MAG TPA: DUF3131 domain-containing protein, partial [Thermoanaerobaculia bacterium]|nr:DUF3131 domain-containing protein [Thermoanaerobaculia bacterium]